MDHNIYSEVTPEIIRLAKMSETADIIETDLFTKYDVRSEERRVGKECRL